MRSVSLAAHLEGRRNNLDFLRFSLAALVILAHSCQLLPNRAVYDPFVLLSHGQMDSGALAVNFFFVISGLLITASWARSQGVFDFLRKRIVRMYPAVVAMSLFCLFIVGPLGTSDLSTYAGALSPWRFLHKVLMLDVPGMPGMFAHNPGDHGLNTAMWTLKYEFGCYLAVAGLGLLGIFRRRWMVLPLFAATMGFWLWQRGAVASTLPAPLMKGSPLEPWPRLGAFFVAGMAMYLYREKVSFSRVNLAACAIVLAASLWGFLPLALPVCGSYLLFHAAFSPRLPLRNFGKRGDLSYGVYLYGWPVQQTLIHFTRAWMTPQLLFPLALAIAAGLAALSWHFVEKPCLRWKGKTACTATPKPAPSRAPERRTSPARA